MIHGIMDVDVRRFATAKSTMGRQVYVIQDKEARNPGCIVTFPCVNGIVSIALTSPYCGRIRPLHVRSAILEMLFGTWNHGNSPQSTLKKFRLDVSMTPDRAS